MTLGGDLPADFRASGRLASTSSELYAGHEIRGFLRKQG